MRSGAISTAGASVWWRYSPVAPTTPKMISTKDTAPPTLSASRLADTVSGSPPRIEAITTSRSSATAAIAKPIAVRVERSLIASPRIRPVTGRPSA